MAISIANVAAGIALLRIGIGGPVAACLTGIALGAETDVMPYLVSRHFGIRAFGRYLRPFMCRFANLRQVDWLGEEAPLPRPRLQVVHGTVPPKCARNTLPARLGMLCRRALGELRDRPLPTSATRAPEATPN